MGIDIDDEIIIEADFLGGVRKNVACVGLGRDLGQLAHAQSTFAVLAIARHGFWHGFLRSRGGRRGRASATRAKYQQLSVCEMLAAAAGRADYVDRPFAPVLRNAGRTFCGLVSKRTFWL